jgi:hypothetical protein
MFATVRIATRGSRSVGLFVALAAAASPAPAETARTSFGVYATVLPICTAVSNERGADVSCTSDWTVSVTTPWYQRPATQDRATTTAESATLFVTVSY